jgi:hypothetical protein
LLGWQAVSSLKLTSLEPAALSVVTTMVATGGLVLHNIEAHTVESLCHLSFEMMKHPQMVGLYSMLSEDDPIEIIVVIS